MVMRLLCLALCTSFCNCFLCLKTPTTAKWQHVTLIRSSIPSKVINFHSFCILQGRSPTDVLAARATQFEYGRDEIPMFTQTILKDRVDCINGDLILQDKIIINRYYDNIRSLYFEVVNEYKRGYWDDPDFVSVEDDLAALLAVSYAGYFGFTDRQMANFKKWSNELNSDYQDISERLAIEGQELKSLQSSKDQEIANKDQEIARQDQEIKTLKKRSVQKSDIKPKVAAIAKILSSM